MNVFIPFLVPTVAELLGLIDEVDTVETKNKLAACLNTVIERSRAEVDSFWRFCLLVGLTVV